MRNKILFFSTFLLFLVSCSNTITNNQKFVLKNYNALDSLQKVSVDSVNPYMKIMDKATETEKNEFGAMAFIAKGVINNAKLAQYDLGIKNFEEALKLLKSNPIDSLVSRAYNGIAACHKNKGDYPLALQFQQKALDILEKNKKSNQDDIARVYANMGQVYFQKNDIDLSKQALEKVLKIHSNSNFKDSYLIASHTLANIYGMSGDFKKAFEIDEKCIKICLKNKNNHFLTTFLDNKANCFFYSGQLDSASVYFNKCLEIELKSNTQKQIADTYGNLAQLELKRNNLKSAEKYIFESITIFKKIKNNPNLAPKYQVLSELYVSKGENENALKAKDSMFETYKKMISEKKEASISEFNAVFEAQKKETEILKKNNQIIITSLIALSFLLIGFLIYKNQKTKNRQQKQESALKEALLKIEAENQLQEQRLGISKELHDNIGSQLTFVISAIDTLKHSYPNTNEKIDSQLENINSFTKNTITELRDTVWVMNTKEINSNELKLRLFENIERAKMSHQNIDFKVNINNFEIENSNVALNLFRTIQEALNNALKYANATEIEIVVHEKNKQIMALVSDNGLGFDIATIKKGNGLKNMRKRIQTINGTFNIESQENLGTKISVVISKST